MLLAVEVKDESSSVLIVPSLLESIDEISCDIGSSELVEVVEVDDVEEVEDVVESVEDVLAVSLKGGGPLVTLDRKELSSLSLIVPSLSESTVASSCDNSSLELVDVDDVAVVLDVSVEDDVDDESVEDTDVAELMAAWIVVSRLRISLLKSPLPLPVKAESVLVDVVALESVEDELLVVESVEVLTLLI